MSNKLKYEDAIALLNSLLFSCTTNVGNKNYKDAEKDLTKAYKLIKNLPKLIKIEQKLNNRNVLAEENKNLKNLVNNAKKQLNEQRNIIDELNKNILNTSNIGK